MKKSIIVLVTTLLSVSLMAQNEGVPQERTWHRVLKSYNIFFDVNDTKLDSTYKTNARTMEQLKADCQPTLLYGASLPDTIYIHATSSPDGPNALNVRLAKQRALSTKQYLIDLAPEFAKSNFVIEHHVEDWDGLRQVLLSDQNFPQREDMLKVLSDIKSYNNVHSTLKGYNAGWDYFVNNHLHALRNSSIRLVVLSDNPDDEFLRGNANQLARVEAPAGPMLVAPETPIIYKPAATHQWRKMIFAVRTNLLVPGMSVGLEFPIKDNWSIGLDYYYPWILPKSNKWCLQTLGGLMEVKYWFPGKKYQWTREERLQGHAVGVYGGVGYYDYQKKDNGLQGEFVDFGFDYTFALPVAKGKLRMEFNIGLGYVRTWYRPYYMSSDYVDLIKEPGILYNTTNFFGPTKAGVSLVVPIVVKTKAPRKIRKGGE